MIKFTSSAAYAFATFKYDPSVVNVMRGIPGFRKWDGKRKQWKFKPTRAALEYLLKHFPNAQWDERLQGRLEEIKQKAAIVHDVPLVPFKFKTTPYDHQHKAFSLACNRDAFAWLMDMGTGKTKVAIDDMAYQFVNNKIDTAVVICPNSIKSNWVEEIAIHMVDYVKYKTAMWKADARKAEMELLDDLWTPDPDTLRIMIVNVEALSSKRGAEYVEKFVRSSRCGVYIDESSRIKTPGVNRTKTCLRLGKAAPIRRIMTGTFITQSPMDCFPQLSFLDEDILGYDSFYSFRNQYAEMGGYEGKEIVAYKNLDELQEIIQGASYRVLKDDCLDLPDKVYTKRVVEMNPVQKKTYADMKKSMVAELEDGSITSAQIALVQLLRFQQIVGGFAGTEEDGYVPLGKTNPGVQEVLNIAEEHTGKIIIWARFIHEIEAIEQALTENWGEEQVVTFHGGVDNDERTVRRQRFQDPDDEARFFVAQQGAGGLGLTLTAAHTMVYFSNTFSLEERQQSEDRAHRIGQTEKVTYIDIVYENTISTKILKALREKRDVASLVTGDNIGEWI